MKDLLENLNKEQKQAVTHGNGPLLIVAGAGTGKTTVITRRIAHLVKKALAQPDEIAALTFTEKAAGEMQERVDLLLPLGHYDRWICTFHGFCERVLKAHALDIGLPNDFQLLESVRQWIFVYDHFDRFKLDYYRPRGNPSRFIDGLLRHFSRCKDEMITPENYLLYAENLRLATGSAERIQRTTGRVKKKRQGKTSEAAESQVAVLTPEPSSSAAAADAAEIQRVEEVANAYFTYQKLLLDNNFLDFGDLINYTLELFKKRPKILEYYRGKFKHILVDEFQDTNLAQYELVKMLAGSRRNLVVVGDDDQSIYKFRGASVSNILKFKADYPELREITLLENYRSSQEILDLAYNFIQANNPDRLESQFNISKRLRANISDKGTIEVLESDDLAGEMSGICKKILELKTGQKSSWNDFAVLLRRNATADELLPVLSSHNIPYTFVANKGLYKKPIIVDILSYLRLLDDFHNSRSLYRVLTLPLFKLEPQELSSLLHHAHQKAASLYETLLRAGVVPGVSQAAQKRISLLTGLLGKHAEMQKRLSAAESFVHIVKDLEIEKKISEDTLENAENRELIEQFYKKIESFQQQESDASLHNFLRLLDLELAAGSEGEIKFDPNLGPESVKVLTVHSAKGLEFKNVFVPSMVDQQFPSRDKTESIEIPEALIKDILPEGDFHLQEERRLFYVAVTRAKTNLYFTWAKDYGGKRTKKPSLFLQETHLVPSDRVSQATGKVVFARIPKEKIVYQIMPTQFSYSQLNDFETCPLKYKYQHYLKLPTPGSSHLSFGQTIHKVFEEFLNQYKRNLELPQRDLFGKKPEIQLPEFEFLEQLYQKHWVDDWYQNKAQKEEYRANGQKMLRTFYETLSQKGCRPKYIEQPFVLPLGDYKFRGKLDRADFGTAGIEIWDYKTGKAPKKGDKKALDQLKIYQWAAEEYLKEKVAGLQYWYLDENVFFEEPVSTAEEITALKNELLELMEKIIYTTRHDLFKQEHAKAKDHNCQFEGLE